MDDHPARQHRRGNVDGKLQAVVEHDRPHAAQERVEDGNAAEDEDRGGRAKAEHALQHERRQPEPQAVGHAPRRHEEERRRLPRGQPEPPLQDFVGREQLAAKVVWQQEDRDDQPTHDISDGQLQESRLPP